MIWGSPGQKTEQKVGESEAEDGVIKYEGGKRESRGALSLEGLH